MQQHIYIASNPSMPGLVKVGRSKDPRRRIAEMSKKTETPTPFVAEVVVEVQDNNYEDENGRLQNESEIAAHKALDAYRVNEYREFFKIEVAAALQKILPVIGEHKIVYVIAGLDVAAPICIWTEGEGDHPDNPPAGYRNSKGHGRSEERYADGRVETGPMVKSKKHGQWEVRYADGTVSTGPYVKGKRHGPWEIRGANGTVLCITFENGKIVSKTDGPCEKPKSIRTEGEGDHPDNPPAGYRNGKGHGRWEIRCPDGSVHTGPYVDGEKHGQWEKRLADGTVYTVTYVQSEMQGQWEKRKRREFPVAESLANERMRKAGFVRIGDRYICVDPDIACPPRRNRGFWRGLIIATIVLFWLGWLIDL